MAIFGNLNHMSFGDLITLLATQDGALEVFNLDHYPRVTLYFQKGVLQCLHIGNRSVDPLRARSTVSDLVNTRRGSFEFVPGASPPNCSHQLGWPLDRLLVAAVTVQDEIEELGRQLPHPKTVFAIARHGEPEDSRLTDFWNRSVILLERGASAEDLAARLGMPLDHARYYLLKLRHLGLLRPVRARSRRTHTPATTVSSLLDALKSRFFGGERAWNR